MAVGSDALVPKPARTEFFYFIARCCMIISVPIGGFFGERIVSQADELQKSVSAQNLSIQLLTARVQDKLDAHVSQLSDHELRIRSLEKR